MQEKNITVRNSAGIHCRPSSVILTAAADYPECTFEVIGPAATAELDSILGILSLGLQQGDSAIIRARGTNEVEACKRIAELFETEFDFPPA